MSERALRIFLSYRRDDCGPYAGRLADNLENHLQAEVFLDVESMPLGVDFAGHIEREVTSCDIVIVMIGDDWLRLTDESGRLRIADPLDWVHLEVKAALERNVPVIPVLVEGARMPRPEELPEPIVRLAYRHAAMMRDESWRQDVDRLTRSLAEVGPDQSAGPAMPSDGPGVEGKTAPAAEAIEAGNPGLEPAPELGRADQAVSPSRPSSPPPTQQREDRDLWILWPILSLGTLAVVGFRRASLRTERPGLVAWGIAYSVVTIAAVSVGASLPEESAGSGLMAIPFFVGWLASAAHALIIRSQLHRSR